MCQGLGRGTPLENTENLENTEGETGIFQSWNARVGKCVEAENCGIVEAGIWELWDNGGWNLGIMESFSQSWEIWEFPHFQGWKFHRQRELSFHWEKLSLDFPAIPEVSLVLWPLLPFLWKSGNSFQCFQSWNSPIQRG